MGRLRDVMTSMFFLVWGTTFFFAENVYFRIHKVKCINTTETETEPRGKDQV